MGSRHMRTLCPALNSHGLLPTSGRPSPVYIRVQQELGGSEASPPPRPASPEDMDPVVHATLGLLLPFSWMRFQALRRIKR